MTYKEGVEPAELWATTFISYFPLGWRLLMMYVREGAISVPTVMY